MDVNINFITLLINRTHFLHASFDPCLAEKQPNPEAKNYKTKKKGRNSNIYYNLMTTDKNFVVGNKMN